MRTSELAGDDTRLHFVEAHRVPCLTHVLVQHFSCGRLLDGELAGLSGEVDVGVCKHNAARIAKADAVRVELREPSFSEPAGVATGVSGQGGACGF